VHKVLKQKQEKESQHGHVVIVLGCAGSGKGKVIEYLSIHEGGLRIVSQAVALSRQRDTPAGKEAWAMLKNHVSRSLDATLSARIMLQEVGVLGKDFHP